MKKFTNLDQLQKYIDKNMKEILINNRDIEKVLRGTMQQAVYETVYGAYVPRQYKRRRNNGGLGDARNMHITKVEVKNGQLSILFENLTQGQLHFSPIYTHQYDSMKGRFLTDTIEEGLKDNWYRQGEWSEARPFVQETINKILADPSHLINAVKKGFRQAGFDVK